MTPDQGFGFIFDGLPKTPHRGIALAFSWRMKRKFDSWSLQAFSLCRKSLSVRRAPTVSGWLGATEKEGGGAKRPNGIRGK